MKNIFLEKSNSKCGGEAISRLFSKSQNWGYLWINSLNFYWFSFIASPSQWQVRNYSLPASFSAWFLKKDLSCYGMLTPKFNAWFTNWPKFNAWLPLLREILGNMCIVTACLPACDVMNLKLTLSFSNQTVFPTWPKSQDRNLNILRTKRAFKTK